MREPVARTKEHEDGWIEVIEGVLHLHHVDPHTTLLVWYHTNSGGIRKYKGGSEGLFDDFMVRLTKGMMYKEVKDEGA